MPAEMLNELIEKTKAQLEALSENYIESERYLKEKQGGMAAEQEEYKRLKSWADVYDKCNFETKKMFISYFVKAIYVYRDYDLEIEFNVSFDEFKHFSANQVCITSKERAVRIHGKNKKPTQSPAQRV